MSSKVKHSGIVDVIEGKCVKVRILQSSACAHCQIAGHCNSSDSKEKIVDVYDVPDVANLQVGDEVTVTASTGVAASAMLIGFGVPFIVLMAVLLSVYVITDDDIVAALCALGSLVPCYGIIWLFRDKLRTVMAFEIER